MRRALQLAGNGEGRVSPNPMVGAVIVHDDRIIGEGFHAFYGGPHAEVNAINSVKDSDRALLKDSTIYVTLEPCAHFGKTPPCANLIVENKIPRVVIGTLDPNPLVAGKGVNILTKAGIEVTTDVLKEECRDINRKFMKAQESDRPYIILKWAQSADGYMAARTREGSLKPVRFSSPLSSVWVHRLRASYDAIIVGENTFKIDNPRLDTRLWGGNSPKKFVAQGNLDLLEFVKSIRKDGITSLIVEGGPTLLKSFLENKLYDEIRVETSGQQLHQGLKAPDLPQDLFLDNTFSCRNNLISTYRPDKVNGI